MRVGWTPRKRNAAGEWVDTPSSFVSVTCFRKVAEHAMTCVYKGEPVFVRGPLRVREYTDAKGDKRLSVEVVAESLGHDMSRGVSHFSRVMPRTGMTAEEAERAALAQSAQVAGQDPAPGVPVPGAAGYQPGPERGNGADDPGLDHDPGDRDEEMPDEDDAPDAEDSGEPEPEDPGGARPLTELAGLAVPSSPAELELSARTRR
jgi:single-strand DNA-binding protein